MVRFAQLIKIFIWSNVANMKNMGLTIEQTHVKY